MNTLIVNWSSTDYESGIQEYQYQVAYDNGNARGNLKEVTPWISAGGQTELVIRLDKQLLPGKKYFVLVKAKNGVGMWSNVGRSNGIELKDPTPPSKISFSQTGRKKGNIDYVIMLTDSSLSASWYSASDPESGIIGYLFALGTTEGASDVISWSAVKSTSFTLDKTQLNKLLNIKLQKNATYYFSIKAMNGIGVVGEAAYKAVVVN
ncbi:MAG: fibronectin type III domain-containing protein [Chlorobi bacterium]|nr:fibronectin type III domain-containing protein [Chlorobiota bacterium]